MKYNNRDRKFLKGVTLLTCYHMLEKSMNLEGWSKSEKIGMHNLFIADLSPEDKELYKETMTNY